MDAIVLVGGLGTRLRPLTWQRHKSLVPLCNRPAIDYLFDWLGRSGFDRIILALGMQNDDLAAAYEGKRPGGLKLTIVRERQRLESGGAIRHAVNEAKVKGRFVVVNGDVFVDFDFREALHAHEAKGATLTLALAEVSEPWHFGVAALDSDSMITGFFEKPPRGSEPSNLVNAGVWIFEPELVNEIPPGAVRVEDTLFPSLVGRSRPVLGYRLEGLWADIGMPARYIDANTALVRRDPSFAIAPSARIHPDAVVRDSSIGPGSTVGARCLVTESIAWENVAIGEDVRIERSIIANDAIIGPGCVLTETVIGAGAMISAGTTFIAGSSVEPGAHV